MHSTMARAIGSGGEAEGVLFSGTVYFSTKGGERQLFGDPPH
jgi:hypothetical protein